MLSTKEVAQYLRITRSCASKLMHTLGCFQEGNKMFIKKQTLKSYLEGLNPGMTIEV